jgi:hypothetical protein
MKVVFSERNGYGLELKKGKHALISGFQWQSRVRRHGWCIAIIGND